MKRTIIYSVILFIIIGISSCKGKEATKISESDKITIKQSHFAKLYPEFDSAIFKQALKSEVAGDSILSTFYSERNYNPVWLNDTLNTKQIGELLAILDESNNHGLSPVFFSRDSIATVTDSIDSGLYADDMSILYKRIAHLEKLSTQTVIKYVKGMSFGFLDPNVLYKNDYSIPIQQADPTFYKELYTNLSDNPIVTLTNSHPNDEVYAKLQENYRNLVDRADTLTRKIQPKGDNSSYKIGDKSKNITAIANRLALLGDYTDNVDANDSIGLTVDNTLIEAVNRFRKRNSYSDEKEISKSTIDALNRPLAYYTQKLKANMERYRWRKVVPRSEEKHIEVNVASFVLVATQLDSVPLIMNVCVGGIKNKTPLLQSKISYINLNPTWSVPTSISRNEIAVLQKKDPTYLRRHNMKLFKNGKEIEVSSIEWKTIDPSKFGYMIRQDAGDSNSLGRIKFMFNNPYSVYLHDTPSKRAFEYRNRAISHGCVRVQKPTDLAFFCSAPITDLYKDKLYYTIDKQPVSKEGKKLLSENKLQKLPNIINMKQKISLNIDYFTVYTYPGDDALYFADDVYEYDQMILKALRL